MNHSDIFLLVIQQNCSISATFIEASHYVYICRYSITTVGLLICFIHFEWHRHNLHCVICLISWNENSCSISTYVQRATNDVYNNNLFSFNPKSSWKLKDYTAIENKWKRIISILIWKTFFLLIWWVVLSLLSLPFESLPLSHYLCEDSISFTCAYGAPVVVGFFFYVKQWYWHIIVNKFSLYCTWQFWCSWNSYLFKHKPLRAKHAWYRKPRTPFYSGSYSFNWRL